jgi:tRNA A37 methylthiotransferase MiaB
MRRYAGTTQEVLIDGAHSRLRRVMNGRTDGYRPVTVRECDLEIGDLVTARITGHHKHWLEGELVEQAVAV